MPGKKPVAKQPAQKPYRPIPGDQRAPYREGKQWYLDVQQPSTYAGRPSEYVPRLPREAPYKPPKKTPISAQHAQTILTDIKGERPLPKGDKPKPKGRK
jgi:hypothetical protein